MDTRPFADFDIPFHFQHDNSFFTNHGAADVFFIGDEALGGQLIPYKVDTLFDARLQLSGKLLI